MRTLRPMARDYTEMKYCGVKKSQLPLQHGLPAIENRCA